MLKELLIGLTVLLGVTAEKEPITLTFAGDTMMDWSVKETVKEKGYLYPFEEVKPLVSRTDYAVLNLETAVTERKGMYEKQFNFKSDPLSLRGVKESGFDLVSLANNHSMDYQEEGLMDTLNHLDKEKVSYIGAGKDSKQAYQSQRITVKGKRISFLAFSHVLPSYQWSASENKPGLANGYELERMLTSIKQEKEKNDYVFVMIHWGEEKMTQPISYQVEYAHRMIDAGADGIVGHHPHVLQGFEYYKGKPIAYSLGNFLFPNYVSGKSAETGVLTFELQQNEIKLFFNPYYIKNDRIVKKDEKYEKEILSYLEKISLTKDMTIETFKEN